MNEPGDQRLPPLPRERWDDDVRGALERAFPNDTVQRFLSTGPDAIPIPVAITTMLHHPHLTGPWLAFNNVLLWSPALDDRIRELMVLRVAWRTRSNYEWVQHVRLAQRFGITLDEIDAVAHGGDGGAALGTWAPLEAALLAATDQLLDSVSRRRRDVGPVGRAPRRAPTRGGGVRGGRVHLPRDGVQELRSSSRTGHRRDDDRAPRAAGGFVTGDGDGPLAGVRVLELGSFVAGPFAGQLLADLGAEVIKVESPEPGDPMRRWGVLVDDRSIWWSALARNKRLVAVDLRQAAGREVVRRLALTCDVVLENFTPGRLEEWGLGYDTLAKERPRLVMTRVSGFGQTGPRSGEPGFGSIGEAMGGFRELTGSPDRPPARAAVSLGDQISGLFAAFGTLAALRQVERDGLGQVVDVALYEAVFALMESLVADYELAGDLPRARAGICPALRPRTRIPLRTGGW